MRKERRGGLDPGPSAQQSNALYHGPIGPCLILGPQSLILPTRISLICHRGPHRLTLQVDPQPQSYISLQKRLSVVYDHWTTPNHTPKVAISGLWSLDHTESHPKSFYQRCDNWTTPNHSPKVAISDVITGAHRITLQMRLSVIYGKCTTPTYSAKAAIRGLWLLNHTYSHSKSSY